MQSEAIRGNQMDETHLGERARLGARMPIVDGIEGHVIPSAAFQIWRGRQRVACDACILHGGPPDEGGNQGSSGLVSGSSGLIRVHQGSSVLISAHQWLISTHLPLRSAIRAHQGSSGFISAHQCSSVAHQWLISTHLPLRSAIRAHQCSSVAHQHAPALALGNAASKALQHKLGRLLAAA